jgi:hypothetical protein
MRVLLKWRGTEKFIGEETSEVPISLARDFFTTTQALNHLSKLQPSQTFEIELDFSRDFGHRNLNVVLQTRTHTLRAAKNDLSPV